MHRGIRGMLAHLSSSDSRRAHLMRRRPHRSHRPRGTSCEVHQVHGSGRPSLCGGIFAVYATIATSCARLDLLALDPGSSTSNAGMGDTTGTRRRVDTPPLGAVAIVVVVGAVSLEEISTPKCFATDLRV